MVLELQTKSSVTREEDWNHTIWQCSGQEARDATEENPEDHLKEGK